MTGDNRRSAEAVAHNLRIERVFADVPLEQKADYVRHLQEEGKWVSGSRWWVTASTAHHR